MRILLILTFLTATEGFAASAKSGQAVYDKSCKSCHGADGTANPAVAKMMKVAMNDLQSAAVQGMSDGDIKTVITSGKGKMKAQAVSGGSLDDVLAYVRSLKK
jgi:mono/diheme cytochrome c family protein